ncbi:MAG: hypothetical protein ACOCYB_01595 [Alkalispirochaeta sp.]
MGRYRALIDGTSEPWEVERRWRDGMIRPRRSGALFGVVFGIGWLALTSGLVSAFLVAFDDPILGLFALVFVGPGIFMLVRFVPRLLHERRYRNVHLKPARIPVQPGERFEAVLFTGAEPSTQATTGTHFDVRLTCNRLVEQSTTDNNGGRRYIRKIIWERKESVPASIGAFESTSVLTGHVAFDLPGDMPETTRLPTEREKIDWRLEVEGSGLPGFEYSFLLPVYDTRSARVRADEALSSHSANPPVPKGDSDALRAYWDSVWESRLARDGRPLLKRLGRTVTPHTHFTRHEDVAFSCIHVRGDRPARRLRRALSLGLVVLAIALAGFATGGLLLGALVLAIMARSARPVVISVHAESDGFQLDSVDGWKRRSRRYSWDQIGMIDDVAFSNRSRDIMVRRPKRLSSNLGLRIASNQEAEGIAAAIAAVRDRYRR